MSHIVSLAATDVTCVAVHTILHVIALRGPILNLKGDHVLSVVRLVMLLETVATGELVRLLKLTRLLHLSQQTLRTDFLLICEQLILTDW